MGARGPVIAVSGVDCAGKSTQVDLLTARIASSGRPCRVLWYRPGYSPIADALRRFVRRRRPATLAPGASEARDRVFANRWVRVAWIALAVLDAFVHFALVVRWWSWRGEVVVCDRYTLDGEVDLTLRFPREAWFARPLFRGVAKLAPSPSVWVLLWLPWDDVVQRADRKAEPFPDPPDVRAERYRLYDVRGAAYGARVVDASGSIDEVERAVADAVDVAAAA